MHALAARAENNRLALGLEGPSRPVTYEVAVDIDDLLLATQLASLAQAKPTLFPYAF